MMASDLMNRLRFQIEKFGDKPITYKLSDTPKFNSIVDIDTNSGGVLDFDDNFITYGSIFVLIGKAL